MKKIALALAISSLTLTAFGGFHTFGDHLFLETSGHGDHRADERGVICIAGDVVHK